MPIFLLTHYRLIGSGLIVGILSLGLYLHVKADTKARADLIEARLLIEELSGKIDTQNQAVLALKDAAEARAQKAEAALALAQVQRDKAKARASKLYQAKPGSSDLCKSALDLVNGIRK